MTEPNETSSLMSADSLLEDVKVTVPSDNAPTTPKAKKGLDEVFSSAKKSIDAIGFHAAQAGSKVGESSKQLTDHISTNVGPAAKAVSAWTATTYGTLSVQASKAADETKAFTLKAADETKAFTLKAADETKAFTLKTADQTRELTIKTIATTKEKAGPIIAKASEESIVISGRVMEFLKEQAKDCTMSQIFCISQGILLIFFLFGTTYDADFDAKEYVAFRDILAMLLLGFGYLMTFLKTYGLGAVGFTMMLSILSMELNIFVELIVKSCVGDPDAIWPLPVGMSTLIDAEFAAVTLLITFGALIGRTTPLQMLIICVSQSIFYAINKVVFVLGFVGAEDVGGSMTIHMFGAYFGLAVSYVLGPPKDEGASQNAEPDRVSDVLTLIGTTILWVFWPSFVGATETAVEDNERNCVVNTIIALMASTTMTFFLSQYLLKGKFDSVHIANATLAGGVAIGSAGRLAMGPGPAMLMGALAGAASVYGYTYSSPYLETKYGITDTCGVGNLHGYPSLVGAVLSVVLVAFHTDADFIVHNAVSQMLRQLFGIAFTLVIAIGSGYGTGLVVKLKDTEIVSFHDGYWWHTEYYPAMGAVPPSDANGGYDPDGGYEQAKDVEVAAAEAAKPAAKAPVKSALKTPVKKDAEKTAEEPASAFSV